MIAGEVDRFHIGLIGRLGRWTLVAAGLALAVAAPFGGRAVLGAASGAAIGFLLLGLNVRLLRRAAGPPRKLAGLIAHWALWTAKWPIVAIGLYFGLKSGRLAAGWLCVGVSLVPAMALLLALRAIALDAWRSLGART